MDTKPLTTNNIIKVLREDASSKTCFIGCFPRDNLPVIKTFPACLVVNTDPSYKEGEHWLGMYFDRYKTCYFFDSYGNMPEYFGLLEYIDRFSSNMEYNKYKIQGFFSNTCGHYTVFFILMITRGFSIKDIIECFNLKNFDLNDFRISFIHK